ncbi:Facilitated trehalose transporter Tret1 [Chamberlinius hualienensis]
MTLFNTYLRLNNDGRVTTATICVISCLVQLLVGATIGYAAFLQKNINSSRNPFYVDQDEQAWIASITHFGAIAGSLLTGPLLERLGRQPVLLIACLPFAIGNLVIAASTNVNIMYAGRFITGLGQGLSVGVAVIYISEIAPANIRGSLSELSNVLSSIGQLYAYLMGAFVNWNWIAVTNIGLCLLILSATCTIPETPRWLISKAEGKYGQVYKNEAVKVLKRLRNNANIEEEVAEIEKSLFKSTNVPSWRHLLNTKDMFHLFCCLFVHAIYSMGGTVVISQYCVTIFDAAGSSLNADMQTILIGVMHLVSTLLTTFTLDLFGRRIVALVAMMTQALCMTLLATYFYVDKVNSVYADEHLFWVSLFSLMLFELLSSWTDATVMLLSSELFSTELRGIVSAIVYAWRHICMFLISEYFMDITNRIGLYGGFWLCAGCSAIGALFYVTIIPETNKKSLEEVQNEIHNS